MAKFVCTFGLPAAGKSTWLQEHYDEEYIISADKIKESYPGYTHEKHGEFYKHAVQEAKERVLGALKDGRKLIVFDAGSINNKYSLEIFTEVAVNVDPLYDIELIVFTAGADICIARDEGRPQSVGADVILEKAKNGPLALSRLLPFATKVHLVHP
jgi:predicted kinase